MDMSGQTRIFVPQAGRYEVSAWYPTLLGRVVGPLLAEAHCLNWFWFTQYVQPREPGADWGDCCARMIPDSFRWDDGNFRSLRLRFQGAAAAVAALEADGQLLLQDNGCMNTDWRPYSLVGDLGGRRFGGDAHGRGNELIRARLLVSFLHASARLVLDTLVGPDANGQYAFEANSSALNPWGTAWQSIHHLVCNVSNLAERPAEIKLAGRVVGVGCWFAPETTGKG